MHVSRDQILSRLNRLGSQAEEDHLGAEGSQRAAVLVPLLLGRAEPTLLFTKRTEQVETHKGQVSFPGGAVDDLDRDIVHTALREAEEELGLPPTAVEVKGLLHDLHTPTGFIITPVIGVIESLPSLSPNAEEVSEVFEVPVGFFTETSSGRVEMREVHGVQREVWFYTHGSHTIWGATALIVRSLLVRLGFL